jgi:hypothetical protein
MSALGPSDTLSCWEFNSLTPIVNISLAEWPQEVLDDTLLQEAAALYGTLNGPPTNAGLYKWVSLRLWRVKMENNTQVLPLGMLCDLDRFHGNGATIRNNVFRHSGHPEIGGRMKSSGAAIEDNLWLQNTRLNVEVGWLQSWLEGPTHIQDVIFRRNRSVKALAINILLGLGLYMPTFCFLRTRTIGVILH